MQQQNDSLMTPANPMAAMTGPAPVGATTSTPMKASESRESGHTASSASSATTTDDVNPHRRGVATSKAREVTAFGNVTSFLYRHSNFYRIHLTAFILIPLVFSAIIYAIDKSGARYVDCLFLAVSSMTVTGLNTLLMERLSPAQQGLTFLLFFIGGSTGPALITLMIRRYYFGKRFAQLVMSDPLVRKRVKDIEEQESHKARHPARIRPDMIKRIDEPIPLEKLQAGQAEKSEQEGQPAMYDQEVANSKDIGDQPRPRRRFSDPVPPRFAANAGKLDVKRVSTMDPRPTGNEGRPRIPTIGIQEPLASGRELRKAYTTAADHSDGLRKRKTGGLQGQPLNRAPSRRPSDGALEPFDRVLSDAAMGTGYGGFPNPVKAVASAVHRKITQGTPSNGFDRSVTLQSVHTRGGLSNVAGGETRAVSYISFDAVVSGNSQFQNLSAAQKEELGGIEYRAISLLTKIVATYWIVVQFLPIVIIAPIFATRYRWLFVDQDQGTVTGKGGWYAVYNLASAYANCGLSLLDESMGPFTQSYAYVIVVGLLILAGNTAFPVCLRFVIWTMYKLVPRESRTSETLQFLLDHPRRCFIYLFPSHQTWLLVVLITIFTSTDWIAFLVLDIDNPVVYGLPKAARAIDSWFQSVAVRTAGFSITTLSALAPAVQVLYVVMMYLAIYPLALSVRTTNVYEEQAMGILPTDKEDPDEMEESFNKSRRAGRYFAYHARKQLAFDVWWLGLALWAICIVERNNIQDPTTPYFNIFSILFETTSAYGTVGLSLGVPFAAFSLCGDMRILSKLILIIVMIRGRHRALPLAIDRSIMLPSDLDIHMTSRSSSTQSSRSDRSITRDGHVIPNLGKHRTGATSRTGDSTAVGSDRYPRHQRRLSTASQTIQFAEAPYTTR